MAGWALTLETACGLWLVVRHGAGWRTLAPFVCVFALVGLVGLLHLRELRKPFRLVIDAWGGAAARRGTELGTDRADRAGLSAGGSPEGGPGEDGPPPPRLVLWPVPGAELPRKADRTDDGRRRYTLIDTDDMDQPLPQLVDTIGRFRGSRVKRLPAGLLPDGGSGTAGTAPGAGAREGVAGAAGPAPLTALRRPGEFTARAGNAARLTAGLASAVVLTLLAVASFRGGGPSVPEPFIAVAPLGALVAWWYSGRSFRRWVRPRRLLVGPEGLTAREAGGTDTVYDWPGIAAVTVGNRPADWHPWLLVWAEPGRGFARERSYVVDGQEVYGVIRLDRLPGGTEAVVPAVREWSAGRFGWLPGE
ncbi:hypothetical protein [Streptomyces sp. NPDC001068]|uniref:hypothetical protein n=1 Tax=Streptomyces sp. NPDC001068 TaxID=3364544 RepID=UPI0036AEB8E6